MACVALQATLTASVVRASNGPVGAPALAVSRSTSGRGHGRLAVIGSNRQMRELRSGRVIAAAIDYSVVDKFPDLLPADPNKTRISQKFAELRRKEQVAFIPYLTAGDPDVQTTVTAVKMLERCGADIIEIGVPYSDPLADGPVLQAAANRAINGGTNLDTVLKMCREDLADVKVPIVLFVYYNPLLKRGVELFCVQARDSNISGIVVPDLPVEGTRHLRFLASLGHMELVLLTTPTTPALRMKAITEASQGFVYLVSLTGVTGARSSIEGRVQGLLMDLKKATDKPVAVGFGISTPEQAAKLAGWGADGVIIGSAAVKLLGESGSPEEGLKLLEDFATKVRKALPRLTSPPYPEKEELHPNHIEGVW